MIVMMTDSCAHLARPMLMDCDIHPLVIGRAELAKILIFYIEFDGNNNTLLLLLLLLLLSLLLCKCLPLKI